MHEHSRGEYNDNSQKDEKIDLGNNSESKKQGFNREYKDKWSEILIFEVLSKLNTHHFLIWINNNYSMISILCLYLAQSMHYFFRVVTMLSS